MEAKLVSVWLETEYLHGLKVSPYRTLLNDKGKHCAVAKSGRDSALRVDQLGGVLWGQSIWDTHRKTHRKVEGAGVNVYRNSFREGYYWWIEKYSRPLPPQPRSQMKADPDTGFYQEVCACEHVGVCVCVKGVLLKTLEERLRGHFHASTMQTSVPSSNTLC